MNIAAPHQRAIALAARPGAAHQRKHLRFARRAQSVVHALGEQLRIQVAHHRMRPQLIAVGLCAVIQPGRVLRLGGVQPQVADARVVIALFALFPHVLARLRVGGVEEDGPVRGAHGEAHARVHLHQIAPIEHFGKIFAAHLYARPHGNGRLHAHIPQFAHHAHGIGPVRRVEFPVAKLGPVVKVDHDDAERQAAAAVLARHAEQLFLRAVAQLALPKSHGAFGHHGRQAGRAHIALHDGRGRVVRRDPVIDQAGVFRLPHRHVGAKGRRAHGGIVPQQAIALAGEHKGHGALRVALHQLQRGALQVENPLLVLAHAKELFFRVGFKALRGGV